MWGVFLRKKYDGWLFLLFVCGLLFIGLYIFLSIVDPEATSELLIFLFIGILICLVTIASWLLNFGAFIHVDEDSIRARYHWFSRINCKLSDVDFALTGFNTLIIQLKNGKQHTIMGVGNPQALCSAIRRNLCFDSTEPPEKLIEKLSNLKSAKQKSILNVCSCFLLMVINIFVTVFLTDGRELSEFHKIDWIIMAIMGVIECSTIIITFHFTQIADANNISIEKMLYAIRRRVIETKPLLPVYVIAVYTDANYSGRITVCGYPHQSGIYYSVQKLDAEYNLVNEYTSDTYENQEALPDSFKDLIDITQKILR